MNYVTPTDQLYPLFDQMFIRPQDFIEIPELQDILGFQLPSTTFLRITYSTVMAAAAVSGVRDPDCFSSRGWPKHFAFCREDDVYIARHSERWVAFRDSPERTSGDVQFLCYAPGTFPLVFREPRAACLMAQCCHPHPKNTVRVFDWIPSKNRS